MYDPDTSVNLRHSPRGVCMVIIYSRVWINRVRLPILLVISWTRKMNIFLSPFAPKNLVSRDGLGGPVPRQPAHCPHSGKIWGLLMGFFPISAAAASIYLCHQLSSGESRVNQVTQLRPNSVRRRESAGTGLVVLK